MCIIKKLKFMPRLGTQEIKTRGIGRHLKVMDQTGIKLTLGTQSQGPQTRHLARLWKIQLRKLVKSYISRHCPVV